MYVEREEETGGSREGAKICWVHDVKQWYIRTCRHSGGRGEGGEGRACREMESESRNGIRMREKRFRHAGVRGKTCRIPEKYIAIMQF